MLALPANEFKSILKNVFKTGKSDLPKLELWMDELQRVATERTISLPIEA